MSSEAAIHRSDAKKNTPNSRPTVTPTGPKREELEAALAQAEAARESLEAALAEAQAALVNTVTDVSRIDVDREEAQVKVENARARCRQLRAALAKSGHAELITRLHDRIVASFEPSGGEPSRQATAESTGSKELAGQAAQVENQKSQKEFRRRKATHPFINTLIASRHMRRGVGLLGLVLAYLQYYILDIQLQISLLPSVVIFPFQP
jgi:SHS2 domain-containing protein